MQFLNEIKRKYNERVSELASIKSIWESEGKRLNDLEDQKPEIWNFSVQLMSLTKGKYLGHLWINDIDYIQQAIVKAVKKIEPEVLPANDKKSRDEKPKEPLQINNLDDFLAFLEAAGETIRPGKIEFDTDGSHKVTANIVKYTAPANIKLHAEAADADGTISKVEFYNGTHLLYTEYVVPYGFVWRNVPPGNYTLTAKAYDNSGLVTTSTPVHISVVPNTPPVVSIINPQNNQSFPAPADLQVAADAKDLDGRMARVEFYNGSALINTQYKLPYRFVWKDVLAGTYTITAVAIDNWGAQTTSTPVTVRVMPPITTIVSNRPSSVNDKTGIDEAVGLRLVPNPPENVYTDFGASTKNIYGASRRQLLTQHDGNFYLIFETNGQTLITHFLC